MDKKRILRKNIETLNKRTIGRPFSQDKNHVSAVQSEFEEPEKFEGEKQMPEKKKYPPKYNPTMEEIGAEEVERQRRNPNIVPRLGGHVKVDPNDAPSGWAKQSQDLIADTQAHGENLEASRRRLEKEKAAASVQDKKEWEAHKARKGAAMGASVDSSKLSAAEGEEPEKFAENEGEEQLEEQPEEQLEEQPEEQPTDMLQAEAKEYDVLEGIHAGIMAMGEVLMQIAEMLSKQQGGQSELPPRESPTVGNGSVAFQKSYPTHNMTKMAREYSSNQQSVEIKNQDDAKVAKFAKQVYVDTLKRGTPKDIDTFVARWDTVEKFQKNAIEEGMEWLEGLVR